MSPERPGREDKLFGATKQKQQCLLCGQPFWISAGMNANEFFENWNWRHMLELSVHFVHRGISPRKRKIFLENSQKSLASQQNATVLKFGEQ